MSTVVIENDIADNAEISAQTLNNIAIDLGNPEFSQFSDGETYAVDKLNSITAELVSAGIIPKCKNECGVSLSENVITVAEGVGIFENGMKARINEPLTLEYMGGEGYVFLKYDSMNNLITCELSDTEPEGEYILTLAKTESDGTLADKRVFSSGKFAPLQRNMTETIEVAKTYTLAEEGYNLVDTIDLNWDGYNGLAITMDSGAYNVRFGYYLADENGGIYNSVSFRGEVYANSGSFLVYAGSAGSTPEYLQFVINGSKLEVYMKKLNARYYPISSYTTYKLNMF